MGNFFVILFIASLGTLIVGLVKPKLFAHFLREKATRKDIVKIFGFTTTIFFILIGVSVAKKPETLQKSNTIPKEAQGTPTKKEEVVNKASKEIQEVTESKKNPKYQIIYELANKRYDGGKNFYVFIDPINLESDAFKEAVKEIIKKIVFEKGNKISIEVHDKKTSVDTSYKQYGDMSLGRVLNQTELDERAIHLVATYSGDLETNVYLNSLDFFPGAFKDNSKVGKYIETLNYDATK